MDDKRLQSTLKRLGVNNIPGIEEVSFHIDTRGTPVDARERTPIRNSALNPQRTHI